MRQQRHKCVLTYKLQHTLITNIYPFNQTQHYHTPLPDLEVEDIGPRLVGNVKQILHGCERDG
jgi:hypothetical protein